MEGLHQRIRRRGRIGFTLIELLVVIAIIAILAAILFPVFLRAKQMGVKTACLSNLKEIVNACLLYADNNNGHTPGSMYHTCLWNQGAKDGWMERLAPYLAKKGIPPTKGQHAVYQCPAAANVDMSYGITDYEDPPVSGDHNKGMVTSKLKYPSRQMLFYDLSPQEAKLAAGSIMDTGQSNDGQLDGPSRWLPGSGPTAVSTYGAFMYLVYWPGPHGGNTNFALADGHVISLADWNSSKLTYTDSPPQY